MRREPPPHQPHGADAGGTDRPAPLTAIGLPGGRVRQVRPARADDAGAIIALYEELSEDSRAHRFGQPTPRLPARLRQQLADLSGGPVWLAFDGERCVGEARLCRSRSGPHHLAITIADDHQRVGLGPLLARLACTDRRQHGPVVVTISPSNWPATRLARRCGLKLELDEGLWTAQVPA